jgi:hypothetical protein
MIIKLQKSIVTSGHKQRVLIYNEDKSIMIEMNITDDLNNYFRGDQLKVYVEAVRYKNGEFVLFDAIEYQNQDW